jgi:CHAT domain-containing protein
VLGFRERSLNALTGSLLAVTLAGSLGGVLRAEPAQADADANPPLEPGDVTEGNLSPAGASFEIIPPLDNVLRLVLLVEMPTRVVLTRPNSRTEQDWVIDCCVEVPVFSAADGAGATVLRLRPVSEATQVYRYRLKVELFTSAGQEEQYQLAGSMAVAGAFAHLGSSPAALREAAGNCQSAFDTLSRLGDHGDAARVLIRRARLHSRLGQTEQAQKTLEQALRIALTSENRGVEAAVLTDLSAIDLLRGDGRDAIASSRQALRLARESRDQRLEARALLQLGESLGATAQPEEAEDAFQRALPLWRRLGWKRGEAATLLELGYTYFEHGREREALAPVTRSHALWESLGEQQQTAGALRALGAIHSKLGDKQKALDCLLRAREIMPPEGDKRQQAALLSTTGQLYHDLGELSVAEGYYQEALEIARSIDYAVAEGMYLYQIGQNALGLNDYPRARTHYQTSLPLLLKAGDLRLAAVLMSDIALVDLAEGKPEEALTTLHDALKLVREHGPYMEGKCQHSMGVAYHNLGDHTQALQHYSEALRLFESGGYRFLEARTRAHIARLERDRGNLEDARTHFAAAIEVIESIRTDIPGPELRASYFSSTHDYFEFYTDLLVRLHDEKPGESHDAAAFEVSERGRARSLLDSLIEAQVEIREGADEGLLKRDADLQRRLSSVAQRQMKLPGDNEDARSAIAKEIQDLTTEHQQVQALIRTGSPNYAALTQPDPLNLSEVQQELLDERTVLLEYALGDERSYLWAVSKDSYETHRLPARGRIEEAVLRLRDLLTARETRSNDNGRERRLRIQEAQTRYWKEAGALSDTLLGPVAETIANKRLIIISDGALHYLPFAALPVPNQPAGAEPTPLVVEHELVRLPSASTLAVLRDQATGRKQAEKSLAVLADPVFEADDSRLPKREADSSGGGVDYPRLPSTRIEAETIAQLVPAGQAMTAIGFDASRAQATSPGLGEYRIVHFATHTTLHQEHPELSGVALSMFDQQGKPQQGLLRLHDIYNLQLPVDLVVLSACDSYLGKQVRGEGLMGIVRGFMYAGASRVIASLWKVDDMATKELMVRFYQNVFSKGQSPAAALRNAQVDMSRHPDWRSPYHWAAFVLQGEWR